MTFTKIYTDTVEPLVKPGCTIVDVGCGDAEFWAHMQASGKAIWGKLTCMDIDILKAKAAGKRAITNCDVTVGDAFKALKLLEANSSDLTVCISVLDYTSSPSHQQKMQAILVGMKRITKKEGLLVLTFGTYEAGVAMHTFNNYKIINQTPDRIQMHFQSFMYLTAYTEAGAKALLKDVGLEIVSFRAHRLTVAELKEKFPEIPDAQAEVYSRLPIDYVFVCRKK